MILINPKITREKFIILVQSTTNNTYNNCSFCRVLKHLILAGMLTITINSCTATQETETTSDISETKNKTVVSKSVRGKILQEEAVIRKKKTDTKDKSPKESTAIGEIEEKKLNKSLKQGKLPHKKYSDHLATINFDL